MEKMAFKPAKVTPLNEQKVRALVTEEINNFCKKFKERHLKDLHNPKGAINSKIHNTFVASLGYDIATQFALSRSFDSSMGNAVEKLAVKLAELNYRVEKRVEGTLSKKQTEQIAYLLEEYKRRKKTPDISDYHNFRSLRDDKELEARHESDYYLFDEATNTHHLVELKFGGDLDNKKSRSEKEALLEQYAILSNALGKKANIKLHFATAYNKFGEEQEWNQERVLQFFSKDELLIGKDFWNFICKSEKGYDIVVDQYQQEAPTIRETIEEITNAYLKK